MNKRSPGQAFLALIFLIGGIIVFTGVLLAFLASTFIDSGYGYQASAMAAAAATSGAEDALLQLDRNPQFSNPSGYALPVGANSAQVAVTQDSPSAGYVNIRSVSTVSGRTKKINVVVSESTSTDQMNIISWQEIQ